ncbi:hypothetical protein KVP02_13130, partial [Halobacterium salinarum]|nr:hypothetical protein [Halobacterium salinarum]
MVDGRQQRAVAATGHRLGQFEVALGRRIQQFGGGDPVELDATTQRNLALTETMTGGSDGALLATIDHTAPAAGSRRLAARV